MLVLNQCFEGILSKLLKFRSLKEDRITPIQYAFHGLPVARRLLKKGVPAALLVGLLVLVVSK